MALQRMDNVGIVFEDLAAAIAFFVELGLKLEGEMHSVTSAGLRASSSRWPSS
jgi:hypothetical protein